MESVIKMLQGLEEQMVGANNATQRSRSREHLWAGPSSPWEPLKVLEPSSAAAEQDRPPTKGPVTNAAAISTAEQWQEQSRINCHY